MDDLHDAVAQLARSLETLERRVDTLEHPPQNQPLLAAQAASLPPKVRPAEPLPSAEGARMFSVLGKAMLGIAGAYVLRALAESTVLPRAAVVAMAMAYAAVWLVAATRVAAGARFESTTYAAASVLILIPMLWELTLRFGVLPTASTAAVLGGFAIAASALGWNRHLEVVSIVYASGSLAALAFGISTHDPAPFILALLAMAIGSEYSAARHRKLPVRPLVAAAADIAVWALIYTYSSPPGAHPDYKAVSGVLLPAFGLVLLAIYGAGVNVQTVLRRRPITIFETTQVLITFLLAAWGVLSFWPGAGARALGILCLLASAAGYAAGFGRFRGAAEQRNYHVYSSGSVALLLVGGYLILPSLGLAVCLAVAAMVAMILGVRTMRLTLEFHGLACLAPAVVSSGVPGYAYRAIAGTLPASPTWVVWMVSGCAVVCYAFAARFRGEQWWHRLLHLLSAALAVGVTTALLVWLAALGAVPGASHIAVIRTLTTCAIALLLAYSGARWQRRELVWMAYAMLVFVAAKLLFEDLRHGHLGYTAASIFLYAVTLLLVPRLVRLRPGSPAASQVGLEFARPAAHPPRA